MELTNKQILLLEKEKYKRGKLKQYDTDFTTFAEEQIKIITKDVTKGHVPFAFNECQRRITEILNKQIAETGKVRAIILKARQQGISTYCAGRVFWKSYFSQHSRSVVMAHDGATSDALFNMSKQLIKNMDSSFSPEEERSNAKEIILKSPAYKDKEAKGSYRLYTAGSPEAGRGTTPTIAHLSEVAFWQHDEKILAGLFQGIPDVEGTEVILESTANGAKGEFYRMWKEAVAGRGMYIPIFLPWFITPEYTNEHYPEGYVDNMDPADVEYMEKYDLSLGQMYWRELKISEGGRLKFQQEYPATADEAFLMSGSNVFDIDKLNEIVPVQAKSRRAFDFTTGVFEKDAHGDLDIWEHNDWNEKYVVAADVSLGVGQDYSTAVVVHPSRKVVALYRNNRTDPSTFGDILFSLGRYYNNALLAVESNSMGVATLNRLEQMGYLNIYFQPKLTYSSTPEDGLRPGFKTTQATKPAIISHLKNAIVNEDVLIPSATMVQEMKDYIVTESGKTEAAPGCNDDTVMALAIAMEVLRTHSDRLTKDKVPWSQRNGVYTAPKRKWI